MKLGCTAGYDIKSQGDNDEKWPFLFFPIFNLCHSSSRHTIWSTVQSQLGNIAGIYHKIAKPLTNFRNHTTPLRWFPSNFQGNTVVLIGPGDIYNCDDYLRTAMKVKRKTGQDRKFIYNKINISQARLCDSTPRICYFSLNFWLKTLCASWHICSSGHITEPFCQTLKHCLSWCFSLEITMFLYNLLFYKTSYFWYWSTSSILNKWTVTVLLLRSSEMTEGE